MGEKIRTLIRQQWAGLIALFLVLSGGTALATHPGGANTVSSGDIIDNEVKTQDVRDGNMTRDDIRTDAVVTEHIATGAVQSVDVANDTTANALTGTDILNNSLTGGDIQNVTRSVNLPLGSFLDLSTPGAIDFDSLNDPFAADFALVNGNLVIEYDDRDDTGDAVPDEDNKFVGSTFSVPRDYASDGSFALRISKDADQGTSEFIECDVSVNGASPSFSPSVEITEGANTGYVVTPSATYTAGDSVGVRCRRTYTAFPDDIAFIHSVEFRYTATQ